MKLLWGSKDGGPESNVRCWGIEIKSLFSILVLNFGKGSREAYHSHAFNSWSWLLSGVLLEEFPPDLAWCQWYYSGWSCIRTKRSTMHKVHGMTPSNWVLTFRGPWNKTWKEKRPLEGGRLVTLTNGRVEV